MISMSTLGTSGSHSRTTPDEFIQYVFVTLTYGRDESETLLWKRVTRDWNRYIQRIRRLHSGSSVHYLRTIEAHEDLYPHLHAILDFGSAKIRVTNLKFFDKVLYSTWKGQWLHGHSDYQRPYTGRQSATLLYIIKYITKSSTKKTIWRKLLSNVPVQDAKKSSLQTIQNKSSAGHVQQPLTDTEKKPLTSDPTTFFCKQFKIKQCTWSRGFVFPRLQPKSLVVSQSLFSSQTN